MTDHDNAPGSRAVLRDGLFADESQVQRDAVVRLAASRCAGCGRLEFPRRDVCAVCARPTPPAPIGPTATLALHTKVLHPVPGSIIQPPYSIAVARFAQDLQVIGLLIVDEAAELSPGNTLETIAVELPDGRLTYAFRPSSDPRLELDRQQ